MPSHPDPAEYSFLYSLAATLFVVAWYAVQAAVAHLRSVR